MKRRLLGILLGVMLVSVCVGCSAENTTTELTTEAVETTTTTIEQSEVTDTPEETTSTPEATEEASEEVVTETETTEATPEPMETVAPEPTEEPTPEPEPQATYTYTDMSATMYAQQTVNVRDLPDTSGNKIGSLSANDEIAITGKCNETGWYRFDYNGNVAYVSNKYVGDKKVEVAAPANNNSGSGSEASGSTSSNTCPYPLWQPVDEGDKIWWYVTQPDPNWETSGHKETQAWMMDTICDRGVANSGGFVPEGYYGYAENEWIFMGTYSEGKVYYQSFYYATNPR